MLGIGATEQDYIDLRAYLGLDKPVIVQFGIFLKNALHGDFGESIYLRKPVIEVMLSRLLATLQLGGAAIAWSIVLALPLGVYAAVKRGARFDVIARTIAVIYQAAPPFWLGLMLMLAFSSWLRILPPAGREEPLSIILPAITLGSWLFATILRLTRSSMLDVLDSEYVKLSRIKGLPEIVVVWKHAFRNAVLPVITFSTMMFISALAGAVTTETVFAWPGIGQLIIQAVGWRDFPLVQAIVIVIAAMYIGANLAVDVLYAYINPRIRYS